MITLPKTRISEVANRIKILREQHLMLSQNRFAQECDFSQAAISSIELGKNHPGTEIIIKIARKYGVSTEWLLLGQGTVFSSRAKKDAPSGYCRSAPPQHGESIQGESFQDRLNSLREHLGMSTTAFADHCDVARGAMSRILRGDRMPQTDVISRIANATGATMDWLVLGREPVFPGTPSSPKEAVLGDWRVFLCGDSLQISTMKGDTETERRKR